MHRILLTTAAIGLAATLAHPANAHSTLEQDSAPNGSYKAVLRIPHGCDGQPTNAVKIVLPEGFIDAKPMPKAGWTLSLEKGDYAKSYKLHGRDVASGLKTVTWSGGELPDDNYDEFVLSGALSAEAGARLPFIVTQTCASGEVRWDEIAAEGQDPHSLKRPAPLVTIAAEAAGGHDAHAGHGTAAPETGEFAAAKVGDIAISEAWARAMLPGQPAGAAYLTITNSGSEADRLIAVSTPAAGKSEVHDMKVDNGIMTMRPVEGGLDIAPGETVKLASGGLHLMFMQVSQPFATGAKIPVTLQFEKAGPVEIELPVRSVKGSGAAEQHKH